MEGIHSHFAVWLSLIGPSHSHGSKSGKIIIIFHVNDVSIYVSIFGTLALWWSLKVYIEHICRFKPSQKFISGVNRHLKDTISTLKED